MVTAEPSEELRLLRALWHFVWNEQGICDGGNEAVMTWADANRLAELAGAVEDYYVAHGFPQGLA